MQLRTEGLTWNVTGDDIVVLDLRGSVYLRLNGSGRVLWERLAGGCERADLVDELVQRYGVDQQRATDDVESFVASLEARRLLLDE